MSEILAQHGHVIADYGYLLGTASASDGDLNDRLAAQESDARRLSKGNAGLSSQSHAIALFSELVEAADWEALGKFAERHKDSMDEDVAYSRQSACSR